MPIFFGASLVKIVVVGRVGARARLFFIIYEVLKYKFIQIVILRFTRCAFEYTNKDATYRTVHADFV